MSFFHIYINNTKYYNIITTSSFFLFTKFIIRQFINKNDELFIKLINFLFVNVTFHFNGIEFIENDYKINEM